VCASVAQASCLCRGLTPLRPAAETSDAPEGDRGDAMPIPAPPSAAPSHSISPGCVGATRRSPLTNPRPGGRRCHQDLRRAGRTAVASRRPSRGGWPPSGRLVAGAAVARGQHASRASRRCRRGRLTRGARPGGWGQASVGIPRPAGRGVGASPSRTRPAPLAPCAPRYPKTSGRSAAKSREKAQPHAADPVITYLFVSHCSLHGFRSAIGGRS
jgi:hypothetical protein